MYWYWYVPVCTGMYWYVLVCPSMYWFILVAYSMYQYEPVHTLTCWFVPVCSCMYQYVLVYSDFLHTNALISRYSIHQGTLQYNEVPKSPVYLDYYGTSRYKAVSTRPCTLMYL